MRAKALDAWRDGTVQQLRRAEEALRCGARHYEATELEDKWGRWRLNTHESNDNNRKLLTAARQWDARNISEKWGCWERAVCEGKRVSRGINECNRRKLVSSLRGITREAAKNKRILVASTFKTLKALERGWEAFGNEYNRIKLMRN